MSTIITRNSATSGSSPSSLVQGELAINVTDGKLFYGSGSGNVVKEFGITASYTLNAVSASYALTASYVNPLRQNVLITGSQYISGSIYLQNNPNSIYFSGSDAASRLTWNNTDGTLDLGLKGGNVTLQIGQETVARVVNKSGGDLLEADFQAVRVRSVAEGGAQGQRLAVVLAQADSDADSATTLGIVTETIPVNQEGFITLFGQVRGIDTTGAKSYGGLETWVDGDMLYLSPFYPGYLTNVKPIAPQHLVIMGYVEYAHQNNGKIFVKIDNGWELGELHNVLDNSTTSSYGDLLVRSGSVWTNSKQLTGSYGLTGSLTATSFTGSLQGTATSASYVLNAISASYATQAGNAATIDVNVFGSPVESYLLMSNVVATTGVAIGGDADLRYNTSTNVLTVGNVSATTLTGSLLGTASYATQALSSSYSVTASYYGGSVISASYAQTASYAPAYLPLTGGTVNGNVTINGTASIAFLNVNYESASVIYSSGSNQFGDASNDVQTLWGTVDIKTGPVLVTGSIVASSGFTGSLQGTASYAVQALSSSFATTASYVQTAQTSSYVLNAVSASFASTASSVNILNQNVVITGSLSVTSSVYINNALYSNQTNTLATENKILYSIPTSTYDALFVEYIAKNGNNARAGQIMSATDGTSVKFTETTTTDIGSTSPITFTVSVAGGNIRLEASASTSTWTIKTITRAI